MVADAPVRGATCVTLGRLRRSALGLRAAAAAGGRALLRAVRTVRRARALAPARLGGGPVAAVLLRRGEARLECSHQVGHLLGLLDRLKHDLLPLGLLLDHVEN